MPNEKKRESPLVERAQFDAVLQAAATLLVDGKMKPFFAPDGTLECEVSGEDIDGACGTDVDQALFQKVFDTEIRSAMWLLAAMPDEEEVWPRVVPSDDMDEDTKEDWRGRVRAVRDGISPVLGAFLAHFRHKTETLVPGLVDLRSQIMAGITTEEGDAPTHRIGLLQIRTDTAPEGGVRFASQDRAFRVLFGVGSRSETTVTLSCDVDDIDYLIRHLKEVRDELTG